MPEEHIADSALSCPLSSHPLWSSGEFEDPHYSSGRAYPKVLSKGPQKTPGRTATLACLNCRPKKVKCQLENGGCRRCVKFGLECFVPTEDERRLPSSKKVIRELQNRVRSLEKELSEARKALGERSRERRSSNPLISVHEQRDTGLTPPASPETPNDRVSMLARLCGGQWQLNRDEVGQLRFFGPTSSLHVTETVSSSILKMGNVKETRPVFQWQALLPPDLQQELLELYWKYQHPVLQVVHKTAFLDGMTGGQTQYFSELLLCCIFACAARMSENPEIRSLAIMADETGDDEAPFFVKTATALLELELRRPGITTVQSLLLLSVMDCAQSNDTKGWLYAGDACRLAFDIGLHRDFHNLGSDVLSPKDLEIRQLVFWGCFVFDRLWALYLGRPHCIRLQDVTVPRLEHSHDTNDLELELAGRWANLLEILGYISEILNGNGSDSKQARISELNDYLCDWLNSLDATLQYNPPMHPTVYVLHMQYCAAMILLHRPTANFGSTSTTTPSLASEQAREMCVSHASRIAQIIQDYQAHHGSVMTMSGVALHTIATAATTLIAQIIESKSKPVDNERLCLKHCMTGLGQLEKSYLVTRRVRKIIQLVIRFNNIDTNQASLPFSSLPTPFDATEIHGDRRLSDYSPSNLGHVASGRAETVSDDTSSLSDIWDVAGSMSPFHLEDFLFPAGTQSAQSFLSSFESCVGNINQF